MELTQYISSNRKSRCLTTMAVGAVCLAISTLAPAALKATPDLKTRMQANYGKLPLSFETNQGQTDTQVKFLARGRGYALFLTPTEAVLSLKKPQVQAKASPSQIKSSPEPKKSETVLRMQLVGANPTPRIQGKETLPGRVNYLIGKRPSRWLTKIPTYGKITYQGIYPGIDLVYYGRQGQLEYDFVLAPGADPHLVKLAFQGANKIEISQAGELVLRASNGEIRMHKPVIYQEVEGVRKPINGGYVLKDNRTVGFQIATYDAARPLIIDPVLIYSTYLGGSEFDQGFGIAVDQQGQAYVTGTTGSANFPLKNGLQSTLTFDDAFITQFTADGQTLRFSTYLGGNAGDEGKGIAVGQQGQVYVTGDTGSPDFPIKNAPQPNLGGGSDAFVAHLSADGSALLYSTYLGGSEGEQALGIAVDQKGQTYVTGSTISSDFPTKNALQSTYGGGADAFVTKLNQRGSAFIYSTYLGGSGEGMGKDDRGNGIAVDHQGQAYVTGGTGSPDFPTKNALQPTLTGDRDAFVTLFAADGSTLRYSTYLGGNSFDQGGGIAVDNRGQAHVAGSTSSSDFPIKNALQPTFVGSIDAFVAQLSADGATLGYSTYLGGSGNDQALAITVDQRGQTYVTGFTTSTDFPIKDAFQPTYGGGIHDDVFVTQLIAGGTALSYSSYLGGGNSDQGRGIAADQHGQAYVVGNTNSFDFPVKNALQPAFGGGFLDAFVTKIGRDNRP
jgi:hypothetical protein